MKPTRPFTLRHLLILVAALVWTGACAVVDHPTTPHRALAPSVSSWSEVFARPPVIEHEAIVSARWNVPLSGMLDLDDPRAKAAGKTDAPTEIVLPVHVLRHPEHGVFIIDTGVTDPVVSFGLAELAFDYPIEIVDPIESILARETLPFGGALLTHFHLDHVLGLPGLPDGAPIYIGPGEMAARSLQNAATRSIFSEVVSGHGPFREWQRGSAVRIGPIEAAVDVFGDGSLWALFMPGHTAGSMAFVAHTTSGPKMFAGDTSHTRWGFENGVTPGTYSADRAENAESLLQLKALEAAVPEIEVFPGHEL